MADFSSRIQTLQARTKALRNKKKAGIANFKSFIEEQKNDESEQAKKMMGPLMIAQEERQWAICRGDTGMMDKTFPDEKLKIKGKYCRYGSPREWVVENYLSKDKEWARAEAEIKKLKEKIIEDATKKMDDDALAMKFKEMKEWEERLVEEATEILHGINALKNDLDDAEDAKPDDAALRAKVADHRENIKNTDTKIQKYLSDAEKAVEPFKKRVEKMEGALSKIIPAAKLAHDKKIFAELKKIKVENEQLGEQRDTLDEEIKALGNKMRDETIKLDVKEETKLRKEKTEKREERQKIREKLKENDKKEKDLLSSYSDAFLGRKFRQKVENAKKRREEAGADDAAAENPQGGGRKSRRRRRRRTRKGAKKSKKRRRKRRTKKRKAAKKSRRRRRRR